MPSLLLMRFYPIRHMPFQYPVSECTYARRETIEQRAGQYLSLIHISFPAAFHSPPAVDGLHVPLLRVVYGLSLDMGAEVVAALGVACLLYTSLGMEMAARIFS